MDPLAKELYDWYSRMSKDPAWTAYAREQVRFFATEYPDVFGELLKVLEKKEKRDAKLG